MNKYLEVSIKCKLGELLKQGLGEISIGKYRILPLPSEKTDGFKTELLLHFKDELREGQKSSNPEKEGEIILSWLSVILRQKLKTSSFRLNNVQIPNVNTELIVFESQIDLPEDILDLYMKFKSLPLETLERYVRSCECYQEALLLSTNNPTISFFLFVVCIECLSNKDYDFYQYLIKEMCSKEEISKKEINSIHDKFINEYGLKNNFIQFILSNHEDWKTNFSEDEFRELLSSIYKIRSLFTHKGESLEKYIKLIDAQLKSKTVFTIIGDKKLEFPGLNYLSILVRTVLVNFLKKQEFSDKDNIPELALKDSLVNLVPLEAIQEGNFVAKNQIKHRS